MNDKKNKIRYCDTIKLLILRFQRNRQQKDEFSFK